MGRLAAVAFLVLAFTAPLAWGDGASPPSEHCDAGQVYWSPDHGCATLPVLIKRVEPEFSTGEAGAQVEFVLMVLVSRAGGVDKAMVLRILPEDSSVGEAASEAVLRAVRQWEFKPGLDTRGSPVAMYLSLRIRLLIED